MTNDDIAALLEQGAAQLRQRQPRNWIAQFRDCEALPASRAAEIAGADPETIRRWCIGTEHTDTPLGYLVGGTWLGRHARTAAPA